MEPTPTQLWAKENSAALTTANNSLQQLRDDQLAYFEAWSIFEKDLNDLIADLQLPPVDPTCVANYQDWLIKYFDHLLGLNKCIVLDLNPITGSLRGLSCPDIPSQSVVNLQRGSDEFFGYDMKFLSLYQKLFAIKEAQLEIQKVIIDSPDSGAAALVQLAQSFLQLCQAAAADRQSTLNLIDELSRPS